MLIDGGVRLDRSSLTRAVLSPRIGAILSVRADGRAILRGGIGLFTERTPLLAGDFEAFEPREVTSYAPTGATTSAPHATARRPWHRPGRVWNVQYDHKFDDRSGMR